MCSRVSLSPFVKSSFHPAEHIESVPHWKISTNAGRFSSSWCEEVITIGKRMSVYCIWSAMWICFDISEVVIVLCGQRLHSHWLNRPSSQPFAPYAHWQFWQISIHRILKTHWFVQIIRRNLPMWLRPSKVTYTREALNRIRHVQCAIELIGHRCPSCDGLESTSIDRHNNGRTWRPLERICGWCNF